MKKVRDSTSVPQGGAFVYKNPEDKILFRSHSLIVLKKEVKKYRALNEYPIGLLFDDQFEENVCANTPGENTCFDWTPPTLFEKMSSLGKALVSAAHSGFKVVSAELFERRLTICKSCNFFSGSVSLFKVGCKRCGCSGKKLNLQSSACPDRRW